MKRKQATQNTHMFPKKSSHHQTGVMVNQASMIHLNFQQQTWWSTPNWCILWSKLTRVVHPYKAINNQRPKVIQYGWAAFHTSSLPSEDAILEMRTSEIIGSANCSSEHGMNHKWIDKGLAKLASRFFVLILVQYSTVVYTKVLWYTFNHVAHRS